MVKLPAFPPQVPNCLTDRLTWLRGVPDILKSIFAKRVIGISFSGARADGPPARKRARRSCADRPGPTSGRQPQASLVACQSQGGVSGAPAPTVKQVLRDAAPPRRGGPGTAWRALPILMERLAGVFDVPAAEIRSGSRRRLAARARAAVGAIAVRYLGLPASRVAGGLGVTGMAVLRGVDRGLESLRHYRLDPERLTNGALRKVS